SLRSTPPDVPACDDPMPCVPPFDERAALGPPKFSPTMPPSQPDFFNGLLGTWGTLWGLSSDLHEERRKNKEIKKDDPRIDLLKEIYRQIIIAAATAHRQGFPVRLRRSGLTSFPWRLT
ncbi:MAG: hypothetical protein RJP95_00515, partial [Pirellulales bacterium]